MITSQICTLTSLHLICIGVLDLARTAIYHAQLKASTDAFIIYFYLIQLNRAKSFIVLTSSVLAEAAGVSEQLEGLLEARCVLCGTVRGLDVGNESAHFPLGLAGSRRQQALVALVQRTRANCFGDWKDGYLQGKDGEECVREKRGEHWE